MTARARRRLHVLRVIAVCVGLVALVMLRSSAPAQAKAPVYFFSDNSKPIGPHNPLVIRPRGFVLFLDGQWVLQHLRWTGWGSPVARATGISNSSNDIPDAARGRRIKTWADMTLSSPTRWHGHEVYSCFKILVPPPAGDLSGCVLPDPPIGNGWLAGGTSGVDFLSPDRKVWCSLGGSSGFCAGGPGPIPGTEAPSVGASLSRDGSVTLCSIPGTGIQGCTQNDDPASPVLTVGQQVEAGNVLCKCVSRTLREGPCRRVLI
jgi:hypothetical protein